MEIIFHPDYILHKQKGTHPERPDRLIEVMERLDKEDLTEDVIVPEHISEENLTVVHTEEYISRFKSHPPGYLDGGDTYICESTYDIARLSAAGALSAVDISKKGKAALALLRPPGHHAGAGYGGGFCYLNNIALAAAHSGVDKVAILDFDGHHGNGTSDIYYSDPGVLFISTHHYGIYPGTGEAIAIGDGRGEGFNVNVPFQTGVGDSSYGFAWDELIEPILSDYKPKLILVSLGTDGHYSDGMTGLSLSSQAYIEMSKKSIDLSQKLCGGKIAFFLEGGYHLNSLAEIIAGISALTEGKELKLEHTSVYDDNCLGRQAVERTKRALQDHWKFY